MVDEYENKFWKMFHVETEDNHADSFTKPKAAAAFLHDADFIYEQASKQQRQDFLSKYWYNNN
jgi:hypothetical protein